MPMRMGWIDPGIDHGDNTRSGDLILEVGFCGSDDLIGWLIEIAIQDQGSVIVDWDIVLERLGNKAQGRSYKTQRLVRFDS